MTTLLHALHYTLSKADPPLAPETKRILLFESRTFIESWLEHFHTNFAQYTGAYC